MRVLAIMMFVLLVGSHAADARCFDKSQARHHYGRGHLYWHGGNHCWNASPVHRRHRYHHRHVLSDVIPLPSPSPIQWKASDADNNAVDDTEMAPPPLPASTMPWADRWVDITQVRAQMPETRTVLISRVVAAIVFLIAVGFVGIETIFLELFERTWREDHEEPR